MLSGSRIPLDDIKDGAIGGYPKCLTLREKPSVLPETLTLITFAGSELLCVRPLKSQHGNVPFI